MKEAITDHRKKQVSIICLTIVISYLCLFAYPIRAQESRISVYRSTDGISGMTGVTPGSYSLSNIEHINLHTGRPSIYLPMLKIGDRGEAQATVSVSIEGVAWNTIHEEEEHAFGGDPPRYREMLYRNYVSASSWQPLSPDYASGVMIGRYVGEGIYTCNGTSDTYFQNTYTIMTFTTPDGAQIEFVDGHKHGSPALNQCDTYVDRFRGNIWLSRYGNLEKFISDEIYEDRHEVSPYYSEREQYFYPSGMLLLPDGTKYRIDNGKVSWIKDRHGNKITYERGVWETIIRDSRGQEVRLVKGRERDANGEFCDEIKYYGFGGAPKSYKVCTGTGTTVLRSDQPNLSIGTLFPQFDGYQGSGSLRYGGLVTRVDLPDGRSYRFRYTSYSELARVELPSGAAVEYDYAAGDLGDAPNGVIGALPHPYQGRDQMYVYRRMMERRVYPNGGSGNAYESRTTYSRPTHNGNPQPLTVDTYDANSNLVARSRHYFNGNPRDDIKYGPPSWSGKEYKTEFFLASNWDVPVRRVENEWTELTNGPHFYALGWRITETKTTLLDVNKVVKQTFEYNEQGYKTDVYEYDFGDGAAGPLLRHTKTYYLSTNPVNGLDYHSDSIYLLGLPNETLIKDGVGNLVARIQYRYDEASYPVITYGNITGWEAPQTAARGNMTTTRVWQNTTNSYIETHAQYDQVGNARSAWNGNGNQSQVEYAADFQYAYPTRTISAGPGFETKSWYDTYTGLLTSTTDANGHTTTYEYNDTLNRLTKVNRPSGGGWTMYVYGDSPGNLFVNVRSSLDETKYTESYQFFDGLGRSVRQYQGAPNNWITTDTQYDALGRPIRVSSPYYTTELNSGVNPSGEWTTTAYDEIGRVRSLTTPDNAVASTTYNGTQVTVTDQAGKNRSSTTDGLGRLITVIEAPETLSYQTSYEYDALGNLIKVKQGSQIRSFTYDSLSRLTAATNPESGTISYEYDNNGNLIKKKDARGVETNYSYDALNRIKRRWYTGTALNPVMPEVNYYYEGMGESTSVPNSKGMLTRVESSVSTYRYTGFDALGRVTGSIQTTDNQSYVMGYSYNWAGQLISEKYPSGRVVTNSLDNLGRLTEIKGQLSGEAQKIYASTFSYAAHGGTLSMKLGNGLWQHTNYNNRLQPTQIGLGTSSTDSSKLQLNYGYSTTDNNGNVLSQSITVPGLGTLTQNYGYDALNRLQWAKENNGSNWRQTYSYDRYGNRRIDAANTSSNVMPQSNPTFNETNNRIADGQGYHYDAAGNLTRDYLGNVYAYDGDNKQVTYNGGASINGGGSYFYDGEGRRVKKIAGVESTIYVYNAMGQMVAEYSSENLQSASTSYVTTDHLGSTRVVTDGSGNIKSRYDYLPFGEELYAGVGGRNNGQGYGIDILKQKFTGYEKDKENGLDYAQARYYSNTMGRFTAPDPLLGSGRQKIPQSWNRYVYCINNPLILVDPMGLDWYVKKADKTKYPEWFPEDNPPNPDEYEKVIAYIYKSVETGVYWALNPYRNEKKQCLTGEEAVNQYESYQIEEAYRTFDAPRLPDGYSASVSFSYIGASLSADRYGNIFWGAYANAVPEGGWMTTGKPQFFGFGASALGIWIDQIEMPSEKQTIEFFDGPDLSIVGGVKGVNAGLIWDINDRAEFNQRGIALGFGTPGINGSASKSTHVGKLDFGQYGQRFPKINAIPNVPVK